MLGNGAQRTKGGTMSRVLEQRFAEREEKTADHAEAVAARLTPGTYLPEQRIVLKSGPIITRYGYLPTCVVLVALGGNDLTPFVVWYASWDGTKWQFSAGLYEATLGGAMNAYTDRTASWQSRSHEGVIARTN